ncbi:hypothetical protein NBRC10513v2_001345 [Rhodotorula toruloides]|uniref:BY PROTMAP: gi/472584499/gb/EMS22093.1/ carbohydrate esterase family 9 protein [Rhodosporidium toruloides NP11] gi/647395160/emb/CDR36380.1/ RHTO0S02e01354g1_1 [Rhodosporidium toruloides] n=1 Tax=Rhodotorula toruloides TaxID=5286 RepID=A0A0K3CQY1_RHOTO|nr:hypothetical protein AAT19DRAFT_11668 [Rhodotorula toruloides]
MRGLSSSDDEEKRKLSPSYRARRASRSSSSNPTSTRTIATVLTLAAAACLWRLTDTHGSDNDARARSLGKVGRLTESERSAWEAVVERCEDLHRLPGVPESHWTRKESDRFQPGTKPTLVRNATIWTGKDDGKEILYNTDVLLDRGLIVKIGENLEGGLEGLEAVDADGAWVTPGIFDMHSHIGVDSSPGFSATDDTNSLAAPVLPHLRSLDGINGHDLAYRRTVAGGVTTSLILPGSANNVGGQAFVIKLRPTPERTIDSLVLEMPWNVKLPSGERKVKGDPPRWRHMKMACGENIRGVYHQTRLDLSWNFRSNFDAARTLKQKQDKFCSRALAAQEKVGYLMDNKGDVEDFPDDLKLEALVDVLRGKVKVNTHCYETTDLNAFVRHTVEFEFPVAAFHHAHETYLVPDLLKSAWPGNGSATPAVAIFSTNGRYKREAWRGSDYAGKVLSEQGIDVIYKSDHPVSDSRHVLYQAQQGHHFGLPAHLALASVISTPARRAGFDHRIGYMRQNYDADLVLWSAHPLSLGATPQQVWIDGIPQIVESFPPATPTEGETTRRHGPPQASLPKDFDPTREQEDDDFDFLNPGESEHAKGPVLASSVKFVDVAEVILPGEHGDELNSLADEKGVHPPFQVVVEDGKISCFAKTCETGRHTSVVDLRGGSLLPTFTSFGAALGLTEIIAEKSTTEAALWDPLLNAKLSETQQKVAAHVGVKAIDALSFGGKHLKTAAENGVGKAITAPISNDFLGGLSVTFRTGASNILEDGAIMREVSAVHVAVGYFGSAAPVAIEVAALRRLLTRTSEDAYRGSLEEPHRRAFDKVSSGKLPLVIRVDKADVIATLLRLKEEVEEAGGVEQRWIVAGGQEAHLLASELAAANIAVILTSPRAFPTTWDRRRSLPGPPLTPDTPAVVLHKAGVRVAFGIEEWQARLVMWEAAWAQKLSRGHVSREEAVAWISTNFDEMFDLKREKDGKVDFVAFERDPFEFGSRVVATSAGSQVKILP